MVQDPFHQQYAKEISLGNILAQCNAAMPLDIRIASGTDPFGKQSGGMGIVASLGKRCLYNSCTNTDDHMIRDGKFNW